MSDDQLRVITLFSRLSSQGELSLEQLLPCLMNCVNTRSESVVLRSKLCYYTMPVFQSHHVGGPYPGPYHFMRALEEAYRDTHVTCGKCPHRVMDLQGVPTDRERRKVCPPMACVGIQRKQLFHEYFCNVFVQSP